MDFSTRLVRVAPPPVDLYSNMQFCSSVAGGAIGVGGAFGIGGDGGGVEGKYKGGGADGGNPRHRSIGMHILLPRLLVPISQLCNCETSFPASPMNVI
jgi:hypothetical protein